MAGRSICTLSRKPSSIRTSTCGLRIGAERRRQRHFPVPGLDQCKLVYPVKAKATPEGENKQAAPGTDCRVLVSKDGAVLEPAKRDPNQDRDDRPMLALLGQRFDLNKGVVLEGSIQLEKNTWVRPVLRRVLH